MLPGAEPGRVAPAEAPAGSEETCCCFSVPPKAPQALSIPLREVLHTASFPLMENFAESVTGDQNRTSVWKTVIVTEVVPRCRGACGQH